ncbi:Zinc finger, C3HC4 type (RING finger) containing protein [Novymonas esmeraldas]|uniref:Zinc finger, C3HC4 type (RING finger) containing protein n=1 Tax=Novymonas esmeraldas TaxID=1808958 RepID=A0AAW0F0V8_9TRYP
MPYINTGNPTLSLVLSVAMAVVVGGAYLYDLYKQRSSEQELEKEVETAYYRLPAPQDCAAVCARAIEEDMLEQHAEASDNPWTAEALAGTNGTRRGMCVSCLERRQRFMFLLCRHICYCEPCLIGAAHAHQEVVPRLRHDGPVKLPCPICRKVGFVVKTYAS